MVRAVVEPKQFIKNNSKVLEESIETQELEKNATTKEQDLLQSPRYEDLLGQLLIDCENAFLDLQFKSQVSILETIPDQVPQFNQLLEQKRVEWENFIANKHDPLVPAEKLISFWQQGLKICQQLLVLELEYLKLSGLDSYQQQDLQTVESALSIDDLSERKQYLNLLQQLELAKQNSLTDQIQGLTQAIEEIKDNPWHFGKHNYMEFGYIKQFYLGKFEQLLQCSNVELNQEIYDLLRNQIVEFTKFSKTPSVARVCKSQEDVACGLKIVQLKLNNFVQSQRLAFKKLASTNPTDLELNKITNRFLTQAYIYFKEGYFLRRLSGLEVDLKAIPADFVAFIRGFVSDTIAKLDEHLRVYRAITNNVAKISVAFNSYIQALDLLRIATNNYISNVNPKSFNSLRTFLNDCSRDLMQTFGYNYYAANSRAKAATNHFWHANYLHSNAKIIEFIKDVKKNLQAILSLELELKRTQSSNDSPVDFLLHDYKNSELNQNLKKSLQQQRELLIFGSSQVAGEQTRDLDDLEACQEFYEQQRALSLTNSIVAKQLKVWQHFGKINEEELKWAKDRLLAYLQKIKSQYIEPLNSYQQKFANYQQDLQFMINNTPWENTVYSEIWQEVVNCFEEAEKREETIISADLTSLALAEKELSGLKEIIALKNNFSARHTKMSSIKVSGNIHCRACDELLKELTKNVPGLPQGIVDLFFNFTNPNNIASNKKFDYIIDLIKALENQDRNIAVYIAKANQLEQEELNKIHVFYDGALNLDVQQQISKVKNKFNIIRANPSWQTNLYITLIEKFARYFELEISSFKSLVQQKQQAFNGRKQQSLIIKQTLANKQANSVWYKQFYNQQLEARDSLLLTVYSHRLSTAKFKTWFKDLTFQDYFALIASSRAVTGSDYSRERYQIFLKSQMWNKLTDYQNKTGLYKFATEQIQLLEQELVIQELQPYFADQLSDIIYQNYYYEPAEVNAISKLNLSSMEDEINKFVEQLSIPDIEKHLVNLSDLDLEQYLVSLFLEYKLLLQSQYEMLSCKRELYKQLSCRNIDNSWQFYNDAYQKLYRHFELLKVKVQQEAVLPNQRKVFGVLEKICSKVKQLLHTAQVFTLDELQGLNLEAADLKKYQGSIINYTLFERHNLEFHKKQLIKLLNSLNLVAPNELATNLNQLLGFDLPEDATSDRYALDRLLVDYKQHESLKQQFLDLWCRIHREQIAKSQIDRSLMATLQQLRAIEPPPLPAELAERSIIRCSLLMVEQILNEQFFATCATSCNSLLSPTGIYAAQLNALAQMKLISNIKEAHLEQEATIIDLVQEALANYSLPRAVVGHNIDNAVMQSFQERIFRAINGVLVIIKENNKQIVINVYDLPQVSGSYNQIPELKEQGTVYHKTIDLTALNQEQRFEIKEICLEIIANIKDDNLILTITKIAGTVSCAKQNKYIIETSCKLVLEELYVNTLTVTNQQEVLYSQKIYADFIKIFGNQLKAINKGKIVANRLLEIKCRHINNKHGALKAPLFQINCTTLINDFGKIYSKRHISQIKANILDNNHGWIIAADLPDKCKDLNLELIKSYMEQEANTTGGQLKLTVKKLINTNGGIILAKKELLIDHNEYNVCKELADLILSRVTDRELSLLEAKYQKSFTNQGLANQGIIVSLDDQATIKLVYNIYNLEHGAILAKKETIVASLGAVTRHANSVISGAVTNISGLDLNLDNLENDYLVLNAYHNIVANNMVVAYTLDVSVVNGNCTYNKGFCYEKANIISKKGKAVINDWQSKQLAVNSRTAQLDQIVVEKLDINVSEGSSAWRNVTCHGNANIDSYSGEIILENWHSRHIKIRSAPSDHLKLNPNHNIIANNVVVIFTLDVAVVHANCTYRGGVCHEKASIASKNGKIVISNWKSKQLTINSQTAQLDQIVVEKLDVKLADGNAVYRDITCHDSANIESQKGEITLHNWQSKHIKIRSAQLKFIRGSAEEVDCTIDHFFSLNQTRVNHLKVNFLRAHELNLPLNLPSITIFGPKVTINAAISSNNLTISSPELLHAKGKITAGHGTFSTHNFTTNAPMELEQVKVIATGRFIYNLDLFKANNYDLSLSNSSDLQLPTSPVAGNYLATTLNNDHREIHLMHNLKIGGQLNLQLKGQELLVGNEQRQVEIYSTGELKIHAANFNVANGVFLSETKIDLFGKNGLDFGRIVAEGKIPSNLSCSGAVTLGSNKFVKISGADLFIGGLFTVNAKNHTFENVAGKIWCMQDAYLDVLLFLHTMKYSIIPPGNHNIPSNIPTPSISGDRHGLQYSYLGGTIIDGNEPARMIVIGTLTVTGRTRNVASAIYWSKLGLNTKLGNQENLKELHTFTGSYYHGHSNPSKRWIHHFTQYAGSGKIYTATEACHAQDEVTIQAANRSVREGVLVTKARLNCNFHEMQIGTLQNVKLPHERVKFEPLIDLMSLQKKPNALHVVSRKKSSDSVFITRIPIKYELPHIPKIIINKQGFIVGNPHNFHKLYNNLQESQLIIEGLEQQIGHAILGDGLDPIDLHVYLLQNAYKFFDKMARNKHAICWDNLELVTADPKTALEDPILIYQQTQFVHEDGYIEEVLKPHVFTPKRCFDPNIVSGAGGIWAKVLRLIGDTGSSLTSTGFLHGEKELFIKANSGTFTKRQYTEQVTVETVATSSSTFGGSSRNVSYHQVQTKKSQPGGALIGDQINLEFDETFTTQGAEIRFGDGGFYAKSKHRVDSPNIDVELKEIHASASSTLRSASITTQLETKTVVPTTIIGSGELIDEASQKSKLEATLLKGKFIYITAGELLELKTTVVSEPITPTISKKGQALFTTQGYMQRGLPVILDAVEGVYLKSGGSMELHAPTFKTKEIKIIAKEVLLAAVKLKQELLTTGKGLTSWKNYIIKYSDHLLQENAICPTLYADFIQIIATEGNAILESVFIKSPNLEEAICEIEAKVDLIYTAVKLHRERTTSKSGFSLGGFSSPLVDAALKSNLEPIIKSLPLIANIKYLLGSKCEGEAIGHGLLTFYHAYDAYSKIQSGDFSKYLSDQIFSVSSTLKFENQKTQESSYQPLSGFISTGKLLLRAGNAVDLEAIKVEVKKFFAQAKEVNFHSGLANYRQDENTSSLSFGDTLNASGVTITDGTHYAKSSIEATAHTFTEIKAEEFIVLARDAKFKGAMIEASGVFMDIANTLTMETPLDLVKQQSSSQSASVSYNLATNTPSAGFGIGKSSTTKAWTEHQTSITASDHFYCRVGSKTTLAGATLEVANKNEPDITAELDGKELRFYRIAIPADGHDCGFYALETTRIDATHQLLANLENPEIVTLVGQELNNSWFEHAAAIEPYINPSTLLQLNQLLAELGMVIRVLSKLKDVINKELRTGDIAEKLLDNQKVTKEQKARLVELIKSRNKAEQAVKEFFATKEMCEGFLHYVGNSNLWVGFDETRKYQGSMEAIAIINKFNFRIWGVKKDIDGHLVPNKVTYLYSFIGNHDSFEYKELFFTGGHFDRLSTTPGIFSSKEIEASTVKSLEVTRGRDVIVSNLPLGGEHSDKDVLGTMASFKASKEAKYQSNNPSIVGNFTVTSGSNLGGINRDKDNMQGSVIQENTGVFLPYSSGVVGKLFNGKAATDKDQRTDTKNMTQAAKEETDQDKAGQTKEKQPLSKQNPNPQEQANDDKLQPKSARWVRPDIHNPYLMETQGIADLADAQAMVDKYDLAIPTYNEPQKRTSLLKDFVMFPVNLLFGQSAHADELPQTSSNSRASTTPSIPFNYEAFHKELLFLTGVDVSSRSESFLERTKREHRDVYFKATLENDHAKQEQCRNQFSWILNRYRLLKNQFALSDWRPLGTDYEVQSHTVGVSKDKTGQRHYRDLDTGRFSKSALEKAKNSFKQGNQPVSQLEIQATEKLHDDSTCYTADFGRSSIPGIETGGRAYGCTNNSVEYHIDKEGVSVEGSIGVNAGVNIASGRTDLPFGNARLDVDAFSGTLGIGGDINLSENQTSIEAEAKIKLTGVEVKGEFKSEKACFDSNCYQVTLETHAGVGFGVEVGFGYKKNSVKKDTLTISAGLGLLQSLRAKVKVEKEPKQQHVDNKPNEIPKPSL